MDVPRRTTDAEAAGYANDNALVAHHLCDGLGGAEPVLDREHDGLGTEQCARALRRGDASPSSRSSTRSTMPTRRFGGRTDPHDAAAARPLHTAAVLANGGDVLGPGIDCPDVVAGITE